ncbi:MAG TPA: hypothetical protein DCG32_01035, partial [Sphaerochaeta sp.]|nr:hypothetical protein [Sphaerochaeta sp.]
MQEKSNGSSFARFPSLSRQKLSGNHPKGRGIAPIAEVPLSAGYQRFICVDWDKTFGVKERPVWIGSHFPKEVWMEYMRLMKAGATLKDLAEALDINVTTTFYWRHKILTARKDGKSDAVLEEHTQADETFTYLNT